MSNTINTRSSHPSALWPGVKAWFGAKYEEQPTHYAQMFDTVSSDKAYEEYVRKSALGLAVEKPEGGAVTYDATREDIKQRLQNITYALGVMCTKEAKDDGLYEDVMYPGAEDLAMALNRTKETVAAAIYNRAFNTAYTYADGKALCVTDHPSLAGNQSNALATPADLSESSVEDLRTQIRLAKDIRGNRIDLQAHSLALPVELEYEIERILKSTHRVGTEHNDINALNVMGAFPGGWHCNPYLTDSDAWFIRTKMPAGRGMIYQERAGVEFEQDNDFDTKNARASAIERYAFGVADATRAVFGSPGA